MVKPEAAITVLEKIVDAIERSLAILEKLIEKEEAP